MRVTVTRIEWDGTMQRRMVDIARRADGRQWEDLAARALAILPPYSPLPRAPVYHVRVDDQVMLAAGHDLTGSLCLPTWCLRSPGPTTWSGWCR